MDGEVPERYLTSCYVLRRRCCSSADSDFARTARWFAGGCVACVSGRCRVSRSSRCSPLKSTTCARSSSARTRRGPAAEEAAAACRRSRRHVHDRARRVRRDPRPERLGQVDPGPAAVDAAPERRRDGARLRPRRLQGVTRRPAAGQPRVGRGLASSRRCRRRRTSPTRPASTASAEGDEGEIPGSSSRVGFPVSRSTRGWSTCHAGCSRRSRSRGHC